MSTNLKQFVKTVEKFAKDVPPEEVKTLQKSIALNALERVIKRTPVDTGRARGNWQVTTGFPANGVLENVPLLPGGEKRDEAPPLSVIGQQAKNIGENVISKIKPFDIIWISNNVVYIEFLEKGSSAQAAPGEIVALTIQELNEIFP